MTTTWWQRRGGWPAIAPWLATVARLVLGGFFIAAGLAKAGDLAASGRAVAAYRIFPFEVAQIIGAVLPFVEIAVGALLILGLASRLAAGVTAGLLVVFVTGIASADIRGLRIDCGCFGSGGELAAGQNPTYVAEIARDLALIVVAGFLLLYPRSRFSLDARLLADGDPDDEQES